MAQKPIKVSQVNNYIKRILQSDPILGNISVKGEISNLKYHGTGNVYFTLKDESSKLNCFLGAEYLSELQYELSDGMEVIASGNIYVYERGGSYSLNVKTIAVEGSGSLGIAFEKLKRKLEQEGLFDAARKKKLPVFPSQIAVITSETGAAIRDIITTIRNRNSYANIIVFPCLVQGAGAAGDIAAAIADVNVLYPETDVMIVGRGGGSMEELWAFNEEQVARSIFASKIPVISAVGHETDFTIADYVADIRAATPTAAAQLAVPDTMQYRLYLDELSAGNKTALNRKISYFELKLSSNDLNTMLRLLNNKMELRAVKLDRLVEGCFQHLNKKFDKYEARLETGKNALESLNPLNVLKRGYGALTDLEGRIISSVRRVAEGSGIKVLMQDGTLDCTVNNISMEDQ